MNTQSPWFAAAVVAVIAVGAFGWYKWFKVFNSPSGEKYQKMLTQGPFTPTNQEESKANKH